MNQPTEIKKRRKQGLGNQSTSNCNTAQLSLKRIKLCRGVLTRKEMRNSCRAVADMRISSSVLLRVAFVFVLIIANVAPNSSVQDEGNACFDMAASIPGLQIISGNHLIGTVNTLCHSFTSYIGLCFGCMLNYLNIMCCM